MITNTTSQSVAPVANDIRDIKPPIEIPNGWEWLLAALAIVILAGSCIFCVLALVAKAARRRLRSCRPFPRTFARNKNWRKRSRSFRSRKPFCVAVSDTVRTYLEERFEFPRAGADDGRIFARTRRNGFAFAGEQKESLGEFSGKLRPREVCQIRTARTGVARVARLGGAAGGRNGSRCKCRSKFQMRNGRQRTGRNRKS